jgi:hypothetical protein
VLAVESNARTESDARQRIRYAGFPAIKTISLPGEGLGIHASRGQTPGCQVSRASVRSSSTVHWSDACRP